MIEKEFILKSRMGLHARPASLLMMKLLPFEAEAELIVGGRKADGKDVMSIMALNTKQGDCVKLVLKGKDEEAALLAAEEILSAEI